MQNRRELLRAVFEDTQRFYSEDPVLSESAAKSRENTRLYGSDDYPALPADEDLKKQREICVTRERTFEAAVRLHRQYPDRKIAVLNFASAVNPGGGVKHGASAQEEALCRCSTLYPTLDCKWLREQFYDVNRSAGDVRHTDALIYSPDIVICKTDDAIPQRLDPQDFVSVDVISCAAPTLRNEPANWRNPETGKPVRMDSGQLYALHVRRARHILHIAAYNKADILVLGAFGCGAFANDPQTVASAYQTVCADYRKWFDVIDFAVYCRDYETENYDSFLRELSLKNSPAGITGQENTDA